MAAAPKKNFNWRINKWCFTLNNPTDEEITAFEKLCENGHPDLKYVCVGSEVGESGTHHIQGVAVAAHNSRDCSAAMWSGCIPGIAKAHLEKMAGTLEQASRYCRKDEQWIEWGNSNMDRFKEIYETAKFDLEAAVAIDYEVGIKCYNQLRAINEAHQGSMPKLNIQLRDWQAAVWDKLQRQNDRQILFVVDTKGNTGKSTMAKWILSQPRAWGCRGKVFT